MKTQKDRHIWPSDIAVGDEILFNVRTFDRPAFRSIHKLMQSYVGDFLVNAAVACNAFKVELAHKDDKRIHVYPLKKYRSKKPLLDATKHCQDSLFEPPNLPPDEHDDSHDPIAEAETADGPL